jgi:hypothetical protein
MIGTENSAARARYEVHVLAETDVDIERICREYSEEADPPEAFLATGKSIRGLLLGISLEFLERGQSLPCPGLPLVGAAFGPDGGFARAVISLNRNGSGVFRLPSGTFESAECRDTYGYRLCPIDGNEIPEAISQLGHIRAELAKPKQGHTKKPGIEVTVTRL